MAQSMATIDLALPTSFVLASDCATGLGANIVAGAEDFPTWGAVVGGLTAYEKYRAWDLRPTVLTPFTPGHLSVGG